MSGATVDLGNIKFNWKGPWANSTAYVVNDTVFSSPHGYVCVTAHTSHASDANLATSDSNTSSFSPSSIKSMSMPIDSSTYFTQLAFSSSIDEI